MRLKRWASLLKDERGNLLVLGAAAMPLLIGASALALDTIQMAVWKRQLQRSADSAAIAGAHAITQNKPVSAAVLYDLKVEGNNDVPLMGSPAIESSPTSGPYAGNPRAVRVTLSAQRILPFMAFFSSTPAAITVTATGASIFNGKFCMVSLEESTATGISFAGNSTAELGCGVFTNSKGSSAVAASGSARVAATPVGAVGNVPASTGYVQPTTLLPYSPQLKDPFSHVPLPAPSGCNNVLNVNPNVERSADPGCYKGFDIKGTLNLKPGTYFVDGSTFNVNSTAKISGEGVTIVLTSSTPTNPSSFATISIHGSAQLNLTAPTSGPYAHLLFYGDPRAPAGLTNTITGNSASSFRGGMYFRNQDLSFIGNTGMNTECMQFVARRIALSGNSKITNTCPTDGPKAFDGTLVRLVA